MSQTKINIDTKPLIDLSEAFKGLPETTQDSVLRTVHRELAKKHIIDVAKQQMPYGVKHHKDYRLLPVQGDKTGIIAGIVKTRDSWYLVFPEKGTKVRYAKNYRTGTRGKLAGVTFWADRVKYKKPAHRGRIIPQNNFEHIIDEGVPKIIEEYNKTIGDKILKAIDKKIKSIQRKINKL